MTGNRRGRKVKRNRHLRICQGSTESSIAALSGFVKHIMADALPDIIAERLAVVFCGINPGMTAAVGRDIHFAGRSNRFWRVIHLAGFTPEEIVPENDRTILQAWILA